MKNEGSRRFLTWFRRACMAPGLFLAGLSGATANDVGAENSFDPRDLCPMQALSGTFEDTGAEWLFCIPELVNGDLVLFVHGTVNVTEAPGSIEAIAGQLDFDGASIPALLNQLGFTFGVVARSKTGLSVSEGIDETKRLAEVFQNAVFPPVHVYLIGVSQGGLIATLLNEVMENDRFAGALSVCGPIGNFRGQLRYFFDFAVLFDFFFRDALQDQLGITLLENQNGNPHVPQAIIDNWETGANFKQSIVDLIASPQHANALSQVLRCALVPSDPSGEKTAVEIAEELIEESFLGINDAVATLGGNPVGNLNRFYFCSNNPSVNLGVKRFATDDGAVLAVNEDYETVGQLSTPLVTLHNLLDHRVPFWHEIFYWFKTFSSRSTGLFTAIPVPHFGHCQVEPAEALAAFALLIQQTTGLEVFGAEDALPDDRSRGQFRALMRQFHSLQ